MMDVTDIVELILLCALLFLPVGWLVGRYQARLAVWLRRVFTRARTRPVAILHRSESATGETSHE